ncbi:MAG: signal peptidase II [Eubacterium sp.]|nr:signal peptidase II [Eubacterium sp.]
MEAKSKGRSIAAFAISVVALIILDQITKLAAQNLLRGQDAYRIIPGVFELQYLENRGSAFGLLQGQRVFFVVMAGLMVFIIPYVYYQIPLTSRFWYLRVIACLFLAGAVGNAVDRLIHGYVIDFFYFSLIDFPIFNVADIYVTVSTFLLIILMLFYYQDEDFEQIHIFFK